MIAFLLLVFTFKFIDYSKLLIYVCCLLVFDDTNRDADLMQDSLLERKDRFLCITRAWPLTERSPLANDRACVLEDVKIINERDNPPANYIGLTFTSDTREKGTVKKLIYVKMVERQGGMKCICDIIFLYRAKRPPQFYTLIGEINGLQMCVKEGTVPALRPAPTVPSQIQSNLYPNPTASQSFQAAQQLASYPTNDYSNTNTLTKKSDEKEILDCIPFQINPKYLAAMRKNGSANDLSTLENFRVLSSYEIEQHFNYDFHIERSSL